jgi:hypothetical protein
VLSTTHNPWVSGDLKQIDATPDGRTRLGRNINLGLKRFFTQAVTGAVISIETVFNLRVA